MPSEHYSEHVQSMLEKWGHILVPNPKSGESYPLREAIELCPTTNGVNPVAAMLESMDFDTARSVWGEV